MRVLVAGFVHAARVRAGRWHARVLRPPFLLPLNAQCAPVASHVPVTKSRRPTTAAPAELPWTTLPATMARRP